MLVPPEITLSDYIPTIHVISTTTSLANQPILKEEWKYGEPALDND